MAAGDSSEKFEQLSEAKDLSQVIRSNVSEYWAYVKKHADLHRLKPYLHFEGIVAGDPHLGNFGPIPVMTTQGSREMRFVNIDFDDAGLAPFVLDFVRYIAAIKAQCHQMKSESLQESYIAGLKGKSCHPPKKVQGFLEMKVADYDKKAADFLAGHTAGQNFKMKPGSIEHYDGHLKTAAIEKLFPGEQVLAVSRRVEARGGNASDVRVWALVAGAYSRRRIMELKQYAAPGTGQYQEQPVVKHWLAGVRQAFWPGLTGVDYDLITIEGGGLFWIREKRVSLIDVPYTSQKKDEVEFVMELSAYDANILGQAHGRQKQGPEYLAAIENDSAEFHEATKELAKAYLDIAKQAFEKAQASGK